MNLKKLFEVQKILRDRIGYNEQDRLEKLILALLCELSECMNEWRGFKFWSKDQEPRVKGKCKHCEGAGYFFDTNECPFCEGTGEDETKNPLLEEYVDGLHFILEIGIEIGYQPEYVGNYHYESIGRQFRELYWEVSNISNKSPISDYIALFTRFVGLGGMLGFTWEEIEKSYYEKNKINHIRQATGY